MMIDIKLDISNTQRVFTQEENTFFFSGTEQFAPIESTVVGDFNGDSITDLFCTQIGATGQIDTPVVVQLGDGQGQFFDGTTLMFGVNIPTSKYAPRIFSSDFNGDGKTDIFIPDFGPDLSPSPGGQNKLYLNTVDGMTDSSENLPQTLDNSHGASIGDIDLDGDLDLVVSNLNGNDKRVHILLNNGQGDFSKSTGIELPSVGPTDIVVDIDAIDLNSDNLPDLVLSLKNLYETAFIIFDQRRKWPVP